MHTRAKRNTMRPGRARGTWRWSREIPPRYADEDLRLFMVLHEESLRVTARDLDELIRPA
jgi:hypothetical protein